MKPALCLDCGREWDEHSVHDGHWQCPDKNLNATLRARPNKDCAVIDLEGETP